MMVQIALMELRRANGGIARAIALHVQQPDQAAAVDGCSGAPRSHIRSMHSEPAHETDETDEAPYSEQQPPAVLLPWRAARAVRDPHEEEGDPHEEEARRSRIPTCAHAAAARAGCVAGCRP